MWRDRGGSLDCMWAWKQYGGAHNHQTAKQSNLAEKGFFRSQLQRWSPKWCHFLFHSFFCSPNRKRQHFPACNWLIRVVFPGRGFLGNAMNKPRMSSIPTLLANPYCFHRGEVWLVDKHNGANIAIILNVANFFHKLSAEKCIYLSLIPAKTTKQWKKPTTQSLSDKQSISSTNFQQKIVGYTCEDWKIKLMSINMLENIMCQMLLSLRLGNILCMSHSYAVRTEKPD